MNRVSGASSAGIGSLATVFLGCAGSLLGGSLLGGSLVGCAGGHYRVEVTLPAGASATQVIVQVLPSCGAADVLASSTVVRGETSMSLGALASGDYGVRAIVLDASCRVIAEGCVPVHAGGNGGTVRVETTAETPRACSTAEACVCGTTDAGTIPGDAPTDASSSCVDCDGMGRCENLLTDRNHCGRCDHMCAGGEHCTNGVCG
jgi:hypothetical protein